MKVSTIPIVLVVACLLASPSTHASGIPEIGAEVWVEPGNTRQQIDGWMQTLADHQMPLARVFILRRAIHPLKDRWDFSLYDDVFESARQHHVGILATLDPNYPATTVAMQDENTDYINRVVMRYKDSPALDSWLLVNEPGDGPSADELAVAGYRNWLEKKYGTIDALNRAWAPWGGVYQSFGEIVPSTTLGGWGCANWADWMTYGRTYQTAQLKAIADAIRVHDQTHALHVNPRGLVSNLARMSDDLPAWRQFLTSMGASLHPAWHFLLLQSRDQFPLGISYVCDMIRGAAGPKPFWVTELQGGNNIYSGTRPLYPDRRDIIQWLWINLGAGADRVVFWALNARQSGTEAGEWSLLDLQDHPSERLQAAAAVVKVLQDNRDFFAGAKPVKSPITLILSLETMTLQLRYGDKNAHVFETLGFYQALQDLGVPVNVQHFDDYPWRAAEPGQVVILPHTSALSKKQAEDFSAFVAGGHRALVTGLSGFFDPLNHVWPMQTHPPLKEVLGGITKEYRYLESPVVVLQHPPLRLPALNLVGDIDNSSGTVLGEEDGRILATRQSSGSGQTIWIPSLIGNGAWFGDRLPLSRLLQDTFKNAIASVPFRFAERTPGLELRTLQNGNRYATIIANGTGQPIYCRLLAPDGYHPHFLVGDPRELIHSAAPIQAHETAVILWQP